MSGSGVAMPEWLARNDTENGPWNIINGPAQRGEAWTNQRERKMRVPMGGDETNRVIRAHEMMHARVSPAMAILGTERGISEGSIRAAEEFRVNSLVRVAGFDIDLLVDGSESRSGERLAEMEDYAGLVTAIAAMANTKGAAAFLRGVKKINPELAKAVREIEKAVIKMWAKPARKRSDARVAKMYGSTELIEGGEWQGYTKGYKDFTIPLALMLDLAIEAMTPDPDAATDTGDDTGENEDNKIDIEDVKDALNGRAGRWGKLVFDTTMRPTKTSKGNLGKRRTATNMGRHPRRINRMLTDPQRRVFDKTFRSTGGVVIIDQSGSMSLSEADVEQMMEASPGCTIIGYSHRSRSTDVPNIWILAKDGRRVPTVRKGSGGNGVDGPAVRYAVSQARKGEQIVWVCDGTVTCGDNDQVYMNLNEDCAKLVKRYGIHMVADVPQGVKALGRIAKGERLKTQYVGNVGRMARQLRIADYEEISY